MSSQPTHKKNAERGSIPERTRKAESTKQRILDVATQLFLSDGYSRTNLDKVAAAAATTKPTVYNHFDSKQGLFDAVVRQHADSRLEMLDQVLVPSDDPESDLMQFGSFFLKAVLSERTQCWDRLAAAESISHPEVGEMFYRAGPARLLKRLAIYLKQQTESGLLKIPQPDRAAEQLIGLLVGVDLLRTQIGQSPPGQAVLKRRCREAIDVFLAAYRKQRGSLE